MKHGFSKQFLIHLTIEKRKWQRWALDDRFVDELLRTYMLENEK